MSDAAPQLPLCSALDTRFRSPLAHVLLAVVTIGMYVGFYVVLRQHGPLITWLALGIPIAMMLAFAVIKEVRKTREARGYFVDSNEGVLAIASGNLERARATFWRWAERTHIADDAAHARHNLACTLMRQGELRHASAVAVDSYNRFPVALDAMGFSALTPLNIALFHALLGELNTAEQMIAISDQRFTPTSATAVVPIMKTYVRTVVLCRTGHCDDAARLLDHDWSACEAFLNGNDLRPLRILRAFALAATGPRNAGLADAVLVATRPTYPGEYAFLGVAWPEMAAFLAAHQLTR